MAGKSQLREQAKKQWEKIDAEGCKIINDLIVADKERTVLPENMEQKFTGKKGAKMTKVAYDTKIKKYTHEEKEMPGEEPIRLDISDSYIYFSFHPTKNECHNSTLLPLDLREKHHSDCTTLISNQNHTHNQRQCTKDHQRCTLRRNITAENCKTRMLH